MKKIIILVLCCMTVMATMAQNHEYVDMGRAGLWATCNIGAAKPEDAGEYFQWKDNRKEGVKVYKPGDGSNFNYEKDKRECHDYATEAWGSEWRMPTWQEMMVLTIYKWEWDESRNGWLVTMDKEWDPINCTTNMIENGNSIFLPAAGYYNEKGEKVSTKQLGKYWASSVMYYQPDDAWTLLFGNLGHVVVDDNQKIRCTIRPVWKKLVKNIVLSKTSDEMRVGADLQLKCDYSPIDVDNPTILWSSSDENVATVNDAGLVHANNVGTCVIYAKTADGSNLTATCEISVKEELTLPTPSGKINGYDYMDLGLPSGTKWATCNVGAAKPEEDGNYYAWGVTEVVDDYDQYKYFINLGGTADKDPLEEYVYPNNRSIAGTQYDVAHVKWGSTWTMPTKEQLEELINPAYTTSVRTILNGVYGRLITSKINGNMIFLPEAGYRVNHLWVHDLNLGYYWSSTPSESYENSAYYLKFNSDSISVEWMLGDRSISRSVRPVSK